MRTKIINWKSFGSQKVVWLLLCLAVTHCNQRGKVCAPGTKEIDGACVAVYEPCGDSATENNGQCIPTGYTCAEGTVWMDGSCVPTLVCGAEQHLDNGSCVREPLPEPEVTESTIPEGEEEFILPERGKSIVLGGVIDTPYDNNNDGWIDGDWDAFSFSAPKGTYLRITTESNQAALPVFRIKSRQAYEDKRPVYVRYAYNWRDGKTVREVFLPRTDEYILEVTDYNQLVREMNGMPNLPVGGHDYTYVAVVEVLGELPITKVETMPYVDAGDLSDGNLRFYQVSHLPIGGLVSVSSAGLPIFGEDNDVIKVVMIFDQNNDLVKEEVATTKYDTADTLVIPKTDEPYLVVQDFMTMIGPNTKYAMTIQVPNAVNCGQVDCLYSSIPIGKSVLFRWDLLEGDALIIGAYLPDVPQATFMSLLDEDFQVLVPEQIIYYGNNFAGFTYAEQGKRVYLWVREFEGQELEEFMIGAFQIPTVELVADVKLENLPVYQMPPYTMKPAGITHFKGFAGQILYINGLTAHDGTEVWNLPIDNILTPNLEPVGPVINTLSQLFPDDYIVPTFAYLPKDGHYLHAVTDYQWPPVDGTYDLKPRVFDVKHLGSPTPGNPVKATTQGLGGGLRFYSFVANQTDAITVEVNPTLLSNMQPLVWMFNFGTVQWGFVWYVWVPDPKALQMGYVQNAQASNKGETLTFTYISPYLGRSLILVMDVNGSLGVLDTYNITVSAEPAI